MVRELKAESPTLTELNDKFRYVAKNIDILTCYELSPTKTAIGVVSSETKSPLSTPDNVLSDARRVLEKRRSSSNDGIA